MRAEPLKTRKARIPKTEASCAACLARGLGAPRESLRSFPADCFWGHKDWEFRGSARFQKKINKASIRTLGGSSA